MGFPSRFAPGYLSSCLLVASLALGPACNCGGASTATGHTTGTTGTTVMVQGTTSGLASSGTSGAGSTSGTSGQGCGLATCASLEANCGPIGDGCGNILQCGTCVAPETCGGGGVASQCGGKSGCVPRTCAEVPASCGPAGDGCGNELPCGNCIAPETCGGGGTPSVCGQSLAADGGTFTADGGCLTRSCALQGIGCGPAGDGCGGVLDCGGCMTPEICGGAGIRDQCGTPACTPLFCGDAGANCGAVGDGCGGILACGTCTAPDICGGGGVANTCGDDVAGDGGSACQPSLAITPPSFTLQVANGTPSTLQLQASLTGCGPPQAVSASWVSSLSDLASVDTASGLVSAQGPLGGSVVISAGYDGLVAAATLTVVVAQTVFSGTTSSATQAFSDGGIDGGAAPGFIYPLDQVVLPVNLQAPVFQWNPGASGSIYRVTVAGTFATLTAYVVPPNPSQPAWQPDPQTWTDFAQSDVGRTVTLDLAESTGPGATLFSATEQTLTLAASRFAGTIYYWTISGPGQVLQLSPGATAPQTFYVPPDAPNTNDGSPTDNCIACHAVSADGTKMSAELWNGFAPGSGTVLDLTQNPAVPIVPGGTYTWIFSTFDPTGQLLLTSLSGALTLRSALTGAPVPAGSGEGNQAAVGLGTPGLSTQPSWSRDGTFVALMQGVSGDFQGDVTFSQGDLEISQWLAGSQTFSTPSVIAARDFDGNLLANFYPSFSTDDSLLAFTRSSCSYNCNTNDELLVVSPTGGTPIELAAAEGSDLRNRYPNFSPFKEGGYHWMAFFSMRPYGWVTSNQRQIWVAAVDADGTPVSDPSHPAFWLPGQDPTTENNKAQWATLPCVGTSEGCQGDIDCCSGLLCRESDGGSVCIPAAQACGFTGTACQSASDCCTPLSCLVTGLCGTPCGAVATTCVTGADCCSGLGCDAGICVPPTCTSLSCAQQGFDCGQQGDGCGNAIDCGGCDAGACGGGGKPGVCGSSCASLSCAQQGIQCGPAGDGCGDTLECGGCDAGSCGGGGLPGICGTGTRCQPRTCAEQGISCGPAGDGCGNLLQCGVCDAGTCGGGGVPGACGSPACTPQTCASLGFDCGAAGDGCGGLLQCGSCDAGTCGGSFQANVCGSPSFQ